MPSHLAASPKLKSLRPSRGYQKRRNVIASKLRKSVGLGRPAHRMVDIAVIRKTIGASQEEFGEMISYSTRAVAEWEAGKPLDPKARRRITEVHRLLTALSELMPAGELGKWLREPNDAFDNLPPLHFIVRGESDRLWQMIFRIDANVPN